MKSKSLAVKLTEKLNSLIKGSRVNESRNSREDFNYLISGFVQTMLYIEDDPDHNYDGASSEFEDAGMLTFEDEGFNPSDLSNEAFRIIKAKCKQFYDEAIKIIPDGMNPDWLEIGKNFYISANGYDGGFYRTYSGQEYGDIYAMLDDIAPKFGHISQIWVKNDEIYVK